MPARPWRVLPRPRGAFAAIVVLSALPLGGGPVPAAAQSGVAESQEPPFTLRIGARIQARYLHEDADGDRSFHIRRARLSASGDAYGHFSYQVQVGLAGESARLLDAFVIFAPDPRIGLWFGQGKAFFGRQQTNSSGNLQFVDRTQVDGRFSAGRQQGVAVLGRLGGDVVEYAVGVYNGEGFNQPSNPNRQFMTAGRVVFTPLGRYDPVESALDAPASPRVAVGGGALRNTVGAGADAVEVTRVNTEGAFKVGGFSVVTEGYREWADPLLGERDVTDGWYGQAGFLLPGLRHEISGRYGLIRPDTPGNTDRSEAAVGYSYYLRGHRAKLQADLSNLRDRGAHQERWRGRVQFQLTL